MHNIYIYKSRKQFQALQQDAKDMRILMCDPYYQLSVTRSNVILHLNVFIGNLITGVTSSKAQVDLNIL